FFHLALVFPTERLPRYRRRVLLGLYGAFALLAAVYEVVLGSPSAYTAVHLLATATHGLGALTIIAVVIYSLVTSPSALVRRRVSVVALGTLAAFLIPAALMAASACYGGKVPLNAGAFTAFLFPVSLAYAILKQDLFEIDVLLRRTITYGAVVVVIGSLYFALLSADAFLLPIPSQAAHSPLALAVLNLALLFLIAPVRARVQDGAELLVPIRRGSAPMGALALGRKGSGRPYTMHDVAFLRAAASQLALAMTNAGAFARLESLNASLEQQVHERTASLAKANVDLGRS